MTTRAVIVAKQAASAAEQALHWAVVGKQYSGHCKRRASSFKFDEECAVWPTTGAEVLGTLRLVPTKPWSSESEFAVTLVRLSHCWVLV